MTLMIAVGKPRSSGQSLMAQTSLLSSFLLSSYHQSVELLHSQLNVVFLYITWRMYFYLKMPFVI